jgi:hypothetical protein
VPTFFTNLLASESPFRTLLRRVRESIQRSETPIVANTPAADPSGPPLTPATQSPQPDSFSAFRRRLVRVRSDAVPLSERIPRTRGRRILLLDIMPLFLLLSRHHDIHLQGQPPASEKARTELSVINPTEEQLGR